MYLAVKQFRNFLKGRQFRVLTDSKPLTSAIISTNSNYFLRDGIGRLAFISEFTADVRHVKGYFNTAPDALPRCHLNTL